MVTTLYEVKKSHGEYDGQAIEQPTVDFDTANGYYVDFRLLVTDGTSWICTDPTDGAAVWEQDTSKDIEINQNNRTLTEILVEYLNNGFYTDSYLSSSETIFTEPNICEVTGDDMTEIFYVSDCVRIVGSKRNNGEYQVLEVESQSLTFANPIQIAMTDTNTVEIVAQAFPFGLQHLAGALSAYDIWDRNSRTPGINSESIGSYSYSGEVVSLGGLSYPVELTAGLSVYKRPKVI